MSNLQPPQLDEEQQRPLELLRQGKSVFVTGPAGTGKSFVLQTIRKQLPIAVTASTGLAAMNVGGVTYHSWSGIGYGGDPEAILKRLSRFVKDRIVAASYLALDEVSMVSGYELDVLSYVMGQVRADSRPFGGVTVAFFGDFMQLPPVDPEGGLAFESDTWQELNPSVCNLTHVYRQVDPAFQNLLEEIRFGKLSRGSAQLLAARLTAVDADPKRVPIKLYNTNCDVDLENELQLEKLPGNLFTSEAQDWASHPTQQADLDKNCRWPKTLNLRQGARVMLLHNIDVANGLANGSMGLVSAIHDGGIQVIFDNGATYDVEQQVFEKKSIEPSSGGWSEKVVASRTQYPLRLAYAITSHKSQGLSLDKVEVNLKDCFATGQAYVALSRARTLDGLFIGSHRKGCVKASAKAASFYGQ